MWRFLVFLFVLGSIVFSFDVHAQVVMYENLQVSKISVEWMNSRFSQDVDASAIKARMATREGDFFSHGDFDNDLKTLIQDFDRVEPYLVEVDNQLMITLKVWVKPQVRAIFWEGNEKVTTKRLQKELAITPCSVFDRLAFNKAFHKIKAYYIRKSFFEAEVDYSIAYDEAANVVDITIKIEEGRAGRIKKLLFNNFTCEEEEAIIEKMVTKEYNLFLSWLTGEGTFHEEAVLQDQFTIINFLQNEGYADARVDFTVEEAEECDKINLIITADKGLQYFFQDITFSGNCLFCDEDIQALIGVRGGQVFSPDRIRDTVQRITNAYGRKGYIDTLVQFTPKLNRECQTYDVHFDIEEGSQYRVGLIKVFGNVSTNTQVILHETLLVPGEIFNTEKLQKTEERLRNIGYFKNVNVYAVKSDGIEGLGESYRDVHVEVEETGTGHFSAFFGFSTAESLFGGLSITEKNFDSSGLKTLFNTGLCGLRGGGEYLSLSTTIGLKSRTYVLSWNKPYFNDTQWTVGFDIENSSNRYISDDYNILATRFKLYGIYQINAFLRGGVHYRYSNSYVQLDDDAERHVHNEEKHTGEEELNGMISAIGTSLIYDSSDHPQKPHSGFKSRLELEYAGLWGHHHFLNMGYLNSYYIPVDEKSVFKIRGDLRFIVPFGSTTVNTVPMDERLFLGGEFVVRGWRPYRPGPNFRKSTKKGQKVSDEPRGGISLQLYSLEYSRELNCRMDGFVFFDAGYLSAREWHAANFKMLYSSLGFGARVKIFDGVPPVTVGMGFPIHPEYHSWVKRFFFTIGGQF